MSKIELDVAAKIIARAKIGEKKYGTTMERTDLTIRQWINHAQEEAMDLAVYLEKLKTVIQEEIEEKALDLIQSDEKTSECSLSHPLCGTGMCACDDNEIELERRMDIIGRNGNDGLHYEDDDTYWKSNSSYPISQYP